MKKFYNLEARLHESVAHVIYCRFNCYPARFAVISFRDEHSVMVIPNHS